jgi:hypothetical protein
LLKDGGFNYLELFLSWKLTMDPNYVKICLRLYEYYKEGFTLTGHCLVWMVGDYPEMPEADPNNLPEHVKKLSYSELKVALKDHVLKTVSEQRGWVTYWTINEPFWKYADPFHLTSEQWVEICDISVRAIKEAHPEGKILINNIICDIPEMNYHPLKHLKLLEDRGVEFDVIGLEIYGKPNVDPRVPTDSNGYPSISWVSKRLDQFGSLGKPIIITEVGVSSTPGEEVQAKWFRKLCEMAFSKPYVKGIAWSLPFDDPWFPNAGFFKSPHSPRKLYYEIKELTSSWLSKGNGETDNEGKMSFEGYPGNYSLHYKS